MLDRGSAQDFRNSPSIPFAPSTRAEDDPQFSPDGRKVAFASDRSGELAIWVADRNGSDPVQLTNMNCAAGSPRWAPNARRLAFDCFAEGTSHVYLISAEGGPAQRLTKDSAQEILPSWSHDSRWIYFSSNRSGRPQVWKAPVEGGAAAVQITRNGGYDSFESPDGRLLYYAQRSTPGLWSVPVTGGPEIRVVDGVRFYWWALADTGVFFLRARAIAPPKVSGQVDFYSFDKQTVREVGVINGPLDWESPCFTVTRDGRTLLVAQLDQAGSDLMLVNNFE
jgi:Tol biopolymer transport system component